MTVNEYSPIKIWLVDFWHPENEAEMRKNPLFLLISKAIPVVLDNKPDVLFYSVFGNRHYEFSCKRIQFIGENIAPNLSEADYCFSFTTEESDRSFRLPLYRLYDEFLCLPSGPREVPLGWEKRAFCSFLVSNPSNESGRITLFEKLSALKTVSSGGGVLNNLGLRIQNKHQFQQEHRFCIAFENSYGLGYTTEKLIQAFYSGCIPIYFGNPLVGNEFNSKAFVNCHEFPSLDAVVQRVMEIENNVEIAYSMLQEPIWKNGSIPSCCADETISRNIRHALLGPIKIHSIQKHKFYATLTRFIQKVRVRLRIALS